MQDVQQASRIRLQPRPPHPVDIAAASAWISILVFFLGVSLLPSIIPSISPTSPLDTNEIADRWTIVGLWFLVLFSAIIIFLNRRISESGQFSARPPRYLGALSFLALALVWLGITWTVDKFGMWTGFTFSAGAVALLSSILFALAVTSKPHIAESQQLPSLFLSAYVVIVGLLTMLQFPQTIKDSGHFEYLFEELVSHAAGNFPLVSFSSQYSNLGGLPLSPMITENPRASVTIVLIAIVIAQLVVIALPALIGVRTVSKENRWIFTFASLALGVSILLLPFLDPQGRQGLSPATYFQTNPTRTFLPLLFLLTCWVILTHKFRTRFRRISALALIGPLAVILFLNSPDYGVAGSLVGAFAAVLVLSARRQWGILSWVLTTWILTTSMVFLILNAMIPGWFQNWVFFSDLFGIQGYLNEPISPFGLHVSFSSLFVFNALYGFKILTVRFSRGRANPKDEAIAIALVLSGGWGLATLPYFAGRSLTPTLLSGLATPITFAIVATIPLAIGALLTFKRRISMGHLAPPHVLTLAFAMTPLTAGFLAFGMMEHPAESLQSVSSQVTSDGQDSTSLRDLASKSLWSWETLEQEEVMFKAFLESLESSGVLGPGDTLGQSIRLANGISLLSGVPSVAQVSHPQYFLDAPKAVKNFCTQPRVSQLTFLIVDFEVSDVILAHKDCRFLSEANHKLSAISNEYSLLQVKPNLVR